MTSDSRDRDDIEYGVCVPLQDDRSFMDYMKFIVGAHSRVWIIDRTGYGVFSLCRI